ncbi:MAG: NAD-dependent protein deacylase [Bacillales bacterium]|nr:NAD-dependent protein deacylase [Bacillales bacterium]
MKIKDIFNEIKGFSRPIFFTGEDLGYSNNITKEIINNWSHTELLNRIYLYKNQTPSQIHYDLAKLNLPIITESTDGLHNLAGSQIVIEVHGNHNNIICTKCTYSNTITNLLIKYEKGIIFCPVCKSELRPDIVYPGERIRCFSKALDNLYNSDVLVVIGNNFKNWPSNKLISKAINNGIKVSYIS